MCTNASIPDFLKLVLYLTFFCVLCMFYGMPIHIIRDVALTIRSFYKRIRDFVQYKHATRDMNARYPDATAEEISRDDVCIICRENMTAWEDAAQATAPEHQSADERQRAKKLPCGHLLHFACLRSWLERQQICPTCRTPVLNNTSETSIQHRAAGAAAPGRPGLVNPPAGGPRVYTFGPFRLVFGARHINHNLQPNPPTVAAGAATDPMLNRNPAPAISIGVQAQLNQIEQHITREISNLNNLSDQLQLIRALQAELAQLRVSQGFPGHLAPGSTFQQLQMGHLQSQQTLQAYRQMPLTSGTQDFPAGLTIPENWTLHALQRIPEYVNMGTQPGHGDEGASQQVQSVVAHPRSSDASLGRRDFNGPTGDADTRGDTDSLVDHAPKASNFERNQESGQTKSRHTSEEIPIDLPGWGHIDGQDGGSHEWQEGESSKIGKSLQDKGKSKAVTVEDDLDE